MFKLVFSVVLMVLFAACIVLGVLKIKGDKYGIDSVEFKPNKKMFLAVIPLALFLLVNAVVTVPANAVGVKYSKIYGTSEQTLNEGIHLVTPFVDQVYMFDLTVQERTDEEVLIQTKDAQWVKVNVNVKYQINQADAFKVYQGYKTLDNLNTNIIGNYTQEALNQVCTQYNVIDILGEKRNEFVAKTQELLAEKFATEGVTLKSITVKDIDAGEEIEKAISDEAVAKKAAETAKQNQEKAKIEAETKVIEAQGEADANRVLAESVTDELIRLKEAEARQKWGWITVQGADSVIAPSTSAE